MSPVLDGREKLLRELSGQVGDRRVLDAIGAVRRELFVPDELRPFAWLNQPLPIDEGQSISQPLVVAHMCELLRLTGDERVLDVGTGSGYHAAVLSRLAGHVYSIERHASLSAQAGENLRAAGISNVTLVVGDGASGYAEEAPYDAINVAAASAGGVPTEIEAQLAPGGRLIIPTGLREQRLVLVERVREPDASAGAGHRAGGMEGAGHGARGREGDPGGERSLRRTTLGGVRFVPLVGASEREPAGRAEGDAKGEENPEAGR
jgi:protein-L-isoaspartate(D-aspartate) O-methyltransferase